MTDQFHFSPRTNKAHEINWREWGEEAFKEAKKQNKLILLSISAVWCHWCHVMDETAYSYKPNINLINSEFIPIRVDNDKQPDINRIYNMGGWPTTVIIDQDGEIINGGTYMPEKTLYSFLTNTNRHYKLNANKYKPQKGPQQFIAPQKRNIDEIINGDMLKNIDKMISSLFDPLYGGFGIEPKFFHTDALDYLIFRFFNNQEDDMFKVITKTLTNMANGGVFDNQEGGFFRYSTTRDWSIPHFEKMLEDNSKLLDIYLKAYQVTNYELYLKTCSKIIDYINNNLLDTDNGVFFGSQDADEGYYSKDANTRKEFAKPYMDKTIYTDWNAMAISSYIRAYYVLDVPDYLAIAKRCMTFLFENCFDKKLGMYHYFTNSPNINGILSDQIYTINALIDLYETTSENQYIYQAVNIADLVLERYFDTKSGGFFDDIIKYTFAPSAQIQDKSIAINSFCCEVFYRLYDFSGLEKYRASAIKTINMFKEQYQDEQIFAVSYGKPVLRYLSDNVKITIIGNIDNKKTYDMVVKSLKTFIPFKTVEVYDSQKDKTKIEQSGFEYKDYPVGYICKGNNCFNPVMSLDEISNTLQNSIYN